MSSTSSRNLEEPESSQPSSSASYQAASSYIPCIFNPFIYPSQARSTQPHFGSLMYLNYLHSNIRSNRNPGQPSNVAPGNSRWLYNGQETDFYPPQQGLMLQGLQNCTYPISAPYLNNPYQFPIRFGYEGIFSASGPMVMNSALNQREPSFETSTSDQMTRKKEKKEMKKSNESVDNQNQCLVCGDDSTGFHYGIRTCEGCKSFFRRTIIEKKVYYCKQKKVCPINQHQRNKCQYCRLKTCLKCGMNRKGLREDGMPGGRFIIGPVENPSLEMDDILSGKIWETDEHSLAVNQFSGDNSTSSNLNSDTNQRPTTSKELSHNLCSRSGIKRKNSKKQLVTGRNFFIKNILKHKNVKPRSSDEPGNSGASCGLTSGLPATLHMFPASNNSFICLNSATQPKRRKEKPLVLQRNTLVNNTPVTGSGYSPTSIPTRNRGSNSPFVLTGLGTPIENKNSLRQSDEIKIMQSYYNIPSSSLASSVSYSAAACAGDATADQIDFSKERPLDLRTRKSNY